MSGLGSKTAKLPKVEQIGLSGPNFRMQVRVSLTVILHPASISGILGRRESHTTRYSLFGKRTQNLRKDFLFGVPPNPLNINGLGAVHLSVRSFFCSNVPWSSGLATSKKSGIW